LIGLDRQRNRL